MTFRSFKKFEEENKIRDIILSEFKEKEITNMSLRDFYPEFRFRGLYGLRSNYIPLVKYIIPYEQIIVKVAPLESERHFQKVHGLSLDEFIEYVKNKKILPLVCFPYGDYPKFFEKLFKLGHFPRTGRIRAYLDTKCQTSEKEIRQKLRKSLTGKNLSESISSYFRGYRSEIKPKLFLDAFTSNLMDLERLGLSKLREIIFALLDEDPNLGYSVCQDYVSLLVMPILESLEGINTFSKEDIQKAKELHLRAWEIRSQTQPIKKSLVNKIERFLGVDPSGLAYFLDKKLTLPSPTQVTNGLKYLEIVEENKEVRSLRSFLRQIRKEEQEKGGILEDLNIISNEVAESIRSDLRKMRVIAKWTGNVLFWGALLPTLGGPFIVQSNPMKLFFQITSAYVAMKHEQIENFSNKIAGTFFKKFWKRPIPVIYWKKELSKELDLVIVTKTRK